MDESFWSMTLRGHHNIVLFGTYFMRFVRCLALLYPMSLNLLEGLWQEEPLDLPAGCPELWIDEGWPPYKASPMVHGRTMPVWSVFGHERSLLVLQARLLNSFPEKQVKALIGYELGRMAFALLSPGIFKAWTDRLSKVFVGKNLLQGVQSMSPERFCPCESGRSSSRPSLFGLGEPLSMGTINLNIFGAWRFQAPQLHANGITRPIMEFLAMDMVLKAAAPRILRPIVWIGVLMRGGPEALMNNMRDQLEQVAPGWGFDCNV
ncbi:unnamed protein product [Durusdinium trenchii]|uniref:Uncharacterized protein n=1 Tax=Durusdinium trenchii TaxID=1381693 RepID=A0ABP0Q1I6_9DINO